jgi:hypothetical protein
VTISAGDEGKGECDEEASEACETDAEDNGSAAASDDDEDKDDIEGACAVAATIAATAPATISRDGRTIRRPKKWN